MRDLHLSRRTHPLALHNPNSFMWVRCQGCNCLDAISVPLPAQVDVLTTAMLGFKCSECGTNADTVLSSPDILEQIEQQEKADAKKECA